MEAKVMLCRDRSPEAKALGGWFVEIKQMVMGVPLTHSTDWHRTPHGAVVAGLALAYRLGVTMPQTLDRN
jgi:hypothetical protein